MWMLLLVRMITRVTEPPTDGDGDDGMDQSADGELVTTGFYTRQDQLRQTLCDYIMSDFPARCVFKCLSYPLVTLTLIFYFT